MDYSKLTKADIQKVLKERFGIDVSLRARKSTLIALLEAEIDKLERCPDHKIGINVPDDEELGINLPMVAFAALLLVGVVALAIAL